MQRALVVVESSEKTKELVREAAALAGGVSASLVLLHVTSDSEYEQDRKAMEGIAGDENASYDVDRAGEGARQFARDIGRQLLGDGAEYTAVGAVGSKTEQVLRVADEEGCDHVFIAGRRRSPSGKAIFGDAAQRVILNFDGPVTVVTAPDEEL